MGSEYSPFSVTVLHMGTPRPHHKLPRFFVLVALAIGSVAALPSTAHAAKFAPRPNAQCHKLHRVVATPEAVLRCEPNARGLKVWRVQRGKGSTRFSQLPSSQGNVAQEHLPYSTKNTFVTGALEPETVSVAPSPTAQAIESESSYPVLPDPDNGGSPEVIIVPPEETERPNPALPARVSGFELRTLGETSATFTLTPMAGVSLYQVYVRYGDSFTLKGIDGSNPSVTFTDLTQDWAYTACAYYHLNSVESEKSCLNFRTLGTRPVEPVPAAGPTVVTATATETTITVNWSAVSDASWYSICHVRDDAMQCGGYTMLTDTSAIFQDGSISAGGDYTINVQAVFADSSRSRESSTTVRSLGSRPVPNAKLAGVTNLRVVSVTPTTARVVWEYADSSRINVWSVTSRHLTSYSSTGVDASAREFTITNLAPGLGYEITIQGRSDSNETEVVSTSVLMPNG